VLLSYCCRELLRDSKVRFAGYMISHPLEHDVLVKAQTSKSVSPHDAIVHACVRLEQDYESLGKAFEEGLQKVDLDGDDPAGGM